MSDGTYSIQHEVHKCKILLRRVGFLKRFRTIINPIFFSIHSWKHYLFLNFSIESTVIDNKILAKLTHFRNLSFFFLILFTYMRESKQAWAEGYGERRSRLPTEQGLPPTLHGTWSQDTPRIMTWAKGRCLIHWATGHSQEPILIVIKSQETWIIWLYFQEAKIY